MLEVSRSDVSCDEYQQFPLEKRFIKLSVEKYLGLSDLRANRPQMAIINALQNPKYRFVTAAISRRLGKTYIANIIGHLVALMPGASVLVMSPNYSLSAISFDLQVQFAKNTGIEITRNNVKDRILELSNGSSIRLGSVMQADSVVGRSYDFIIFDEAALTAEGENAFQIQLRPTMDKPNSKALFISTPRGKNNWFAKFFYRGYTTDFKEWCSIKADYRENPRIIQSDVEEARRSMSSAMFRQEYEADFAVFEGQIFRFNSDCIENLAHIDGVDLDVFAGIDVGFRDPTAMIVIGYDSRTEKYFALEEYQNSELTTGGHAVEVQRLIDKYGIDALYIDHAAAQTRMDWAYDFNIQTIAAKKSMLDGIGFVQNVIERNNLIVDERCQNLIATLDQYRWDPNPNLIMQKPEHDQYSHMADALRYGLYSHSTSTGVY
jgi:phage terminase large subunit